MRRDETGGEPVAPVAVRRPTSREVHGETLTDDYAWLRADNWQQVLRDPAQLDPAIRAHLAAETAYAEAMLAGEAGLRRTLVAEMRGRIKEDDATVPAPDGPFAYFVRHRDGGQHPLVCRTARAGGAEQVLLDGDALAAGKAFFHLSGWRWSPDHRRLAFSADDTGSEFDTLRIRDLASGADLADTVPDTDGGAVWSADSTAIYYVRRDAHHRPSKVYRHRLGTDASADELVFEESDPGLFVGLTETQAQRLALITVGDHDTAAAMALDLSDPAARPRLLAPRRTGVRYSVEHHPDQGLFYILTNADGAEDFKVAVAPVATPSPDHWHDLVPHRPGTLILDIALFRRHLVRLEREDGLPRLIVRELETGIEHAVAFAEDAYSLGLDAGHEFDTTQVRFVYSSMTTPAETYDYDMASRARALRKRQEVPSGHDPAAYVTRRLHATAPDGERVPITLLYRATTPLDGTAPCLLYGYGAYGISMPAGFQTARLSLVDRGVVYAIAHVRGGTEKGWRWYREGKLAAKTNTFTDFIAAAAHLEAAGIAAKGRIVGHGGSAGGLLMGAVANMAPERFAGIIAEVPFVDVLATMLDDTLPLTPPEWPEWGNPIADPAAFATIRAYSPVDNVAEQAYPAILALSGLTDPRVTYWEPAKWVAKLRAATTSGKPILLRMNMDAGHAGAAGRFDRLEEIAWAYAFALKVAGR
ncbi:S9 family peptidase [Blastochloris viridis]|uniref:Protease 2 n=1 Tax=Blastochloris viridis TaxID=1079 RepID=A0A0H5BHP2_BLAVI|nr:S9 family peptidase [Blastochloris viridis]ALK10158.1 Protease 2 [Blastochloris viridis]BAR99911.1 protease II [Blastochloris viridis]CUU42822.1 Protease 2 [Blastochloris viridis]